MREALAARDDDDFVTSSPPPARRAPAARRPAASSRRAPPAKARKESGLGAKAVLFLLDHPREALVSVLLAACAGAIAWNALALQTVRHPAPLFSRSASHGPENVPTNLLPPSRPAPVSAAPTSAIESPPVAEAPPVLNHATAAAPPAAPAPVRPPPRSAVADLITKGEVTQPQRVTAAPPPVPAPARPQPQAQAAQDSIADMIRMGGPVPVPPASVGKPEADPVLLGQRALAKLGYNVKPDGLMGSETRQAIERFERDRHLPVTGEFGGRTLRELTSLAGLPMP